MTKIYLDANILVAWQVANHPFHQKTRTLLEKLDSANAHFCISPLSLDEYLYALFKYQRTGYLENEGIIETSLKAITAIVSFYSNLEWDKDGLISVYDLIIKYNLHSRDAFHLQTMHDNEIEYIATLDTDFTKLFTQGILKSAEELLH